MLLRDVLPALARAPVKYGREVAPGVHSFVMLQPMSRVRSYQSNVLAPIGGRGNPTEAVLIGHLHVNADGLVVLVEGFLGGGSEAREWAETTFQALRSRGLLAPDAQMNPTTPLRGCPHAVN